MQGRAGQGSAVLCHVVKWGAVRCNSSSSALPAEAEMRLLKRQKSTLTFIKSSPLSNLTKTERQRRRLVKIVTALIVGLHLAPNKECFGRALLFPIYPSNKEQKLWSLLIFLTTPTLITNLGPSQSFWLAFK